MTRQFPFVLVDAFSSQPLAGNPCAVVLEADALSPAEMLAIAKEMNQSETAFLMKSTHADLRARYFTPEQEIPLAGHPTIASIHAALEAGVIREPAAGGEISLELNDGPIAVRLEKRAAGTFIRMFQRKPEFLEVHDSATVLKLFGLEQHDLLAGATIQTVSTGTRQLMVPLASHDSLRKLRMNVDAYREYRKKMNFFSPHFFALGGVSADADTFARHLGVPPDTAEDAFTGSATGGMAAYLFRYGFLRKSQFIAEQGHWMARPGRAFVELAGTPDAISGVSVAGQSVSVVNGTLRC